MAGERDESHFCTYECGVYNEEQVERSEKELEAGDHLYWRT